MKQDRPTIKNTWQYLLVLVLITIITFLEVGFSDLRNGLIATPFIVVVIVSSIFLDYFAGMLSVIFSTVGVFLIRYLPSGYSMLVVTGTVEFFFAAIFIYFLAQKSRSLSVNNLSLEQSVKHMNQVTKRLKSELNLNKKDIDRLNSINSELRDVVDSIMSDKELWDEGMKKSIKESENKKKSV